MAEMTLEEKLAQLGSAWVGFRADITGDVAPMQSALASAVPFDVAQRDGLGHLTRVFGTAPLTAPQGIDRLVRLQQELIDNTRLGVPAIVHEECLTGFTTLGATVYPAPLSWAATYDPALVQLMAAAIGADLTAVGVHQGLAPVLDVVRDYRWGRVEETMGEDPYLAGVVGSAYVQGLESAGLVATLKHFAGYSASRAARNHGPVSMGRREFADVILPSFELAIREGGARSVMNSYADVDGVPAAADESLLTGLLRDDWGFDGVVVSDYWSVVFLRIMHRIAAGTGEAGALALRAGIDVELPETACYGPELAQLVRAGDVPEALVDRAVRRVLNQKLQLGLLDDGWAPRASVRDPLVDLDSGRNRELARIVAERSVILLANDGTLPLPRGERGEGAPRIAVVGPAADEPRVMMGCYSYPNHVLPDYPELGLGVAADSLYRSLQAELPQAALVLELGCPIKDPDRSGFAAAVAAARDADVCIAAVGDHAGLFGRGTSGEGCDVEDLGLPGVQGELLDELLDTGTPVVVVVVSGRPYALGRYASRAAAIVQAFMPGEEGGGALAGVLGGRVVPTGKLPVQIPRSSGGQPGTYLQPPLGMDDGISSIDPTPLFPFGHGLSYTTYGYDDLELSSPEIPTDGELVISCRITNTGDRAGEEIVQLYVHDVVAQVARPVRQLAGFARLALDPGCSARVSFALHADRTAFTGLDMHRVVEPGQIEVMIGPSAGELPLQRTFRLTGPIRRVDSGRVLTTPVRVTPLD